MNKKEKRTTDWYLQAKHVTVAHIRPINLVKSQRGLKGDLILRAASRLDTFSVYPFRIAPSCAAGVTTGAPGCVHQPVSSRTKGSSFLSNLQRPRQIGTEQSHDVLNPARVPLWWRTAKPLRPNSPQDAMSRHQGANLPVDVDSWEISLLSPG